MKKLLLVWGITAAIIVFIVKFTRIGPVVFVISESHGWGVHSGDSLILIPFALATMLTVRSMKNVK